MATKTARHALVLLALVLASCAGKAPQSAEAPSSVEAAQDTPAVEDSAPTRAHDPAPVDPVGAPVPAQPADPPAPPAAPASARMPDTTVSQPANAEPPKPVVHAPPPAAPPAPPKPPTKPRDTTPPTITIEGVVDGQQYAPGVMAIIQATDANLDARRTSIALNGAPYTSGEPIMADNSYELVVSAADKSGNVVETTVRFMVSGQ